MSVRQLKTALCSTPAKALYAVGIVAGIGVALYAVHLNRTEVRQQVAPALRPAELIRTVKTAAPIFDKAKTEEKTQPQDEQNPPPGKQPAGQPTTQTSNTPGRTGRRRAVRAGEFPKNDGDVVFEAPIAKASRFAPVDLYPSMAAKNDNIPQGIYAPYGMLLRCQLSKSISTSNLKTPIIAQVMDNLEWEGEIVIPAGVVIHGTVSGSPQRDRIGTAGEWLLVWPFRDETSGLQMQLTGDALDCNRTPDGGWGDSDGTAGIRGDVTDNSEAQRMYAYIATFVSGLGEGMVATENVFSGGSTRENTGGTWKDSLGKAFQKVGEQMAQELLRQAVANAYYVQAEAGTQFYIYVKQVIDLDEAQRGTRPRNAAPQSATSPANRINSTNNRSYQ